MENRTPKQDLEGITNHESRFTRILSKIKTGARGYASDTSAALIFYNAVMGANEYFIWRLEPQELLKTRGGMSLAALFISRPYGKFREFWSKKLKTTPDSSRIRKLITDVTGGLLFYSPIYAGIMYLTGAPLREIAAILPTSIIAATVLGRPYGIFLDKWRKLFGVKPTLEHDSKKENNNQTL